MRTIFRDVEAKHWVEQLGLSSLHLHRFVCCCFWLVCLFIFNAVTSRMATSCCRAVLAQAVVHKLLPPYRIGTVVPIVLTQVMSLSSVMGRMHFPGIWQNGLLWSPDDSRAFCSLGQQGQNLTCLNLASAASLLTPEKESKACISSFNDAATGSNNICRAFWQKLYFHKTENLCKAASCCRSWSRDGERLLVFEQWDTSKIGIKNRGFLQSTLPSWDTNAYAFKL